MTQSTSPLVSVGIVTYNRPDGLRRTLEQITKQTYKNLEILISDNCSPNTEITTVAKSFKSIDQRIRYIRQPHNIGLLGNFRFVHQNTRGDYFMWASDDDEWAPEFIEECMKILCADKSVLLAFCHMSRKDRQGNLLEADFYENCDSQSNNKLFRSLKCLMHQGPNSFYYGVYKREVINAHWTAHRFGGDQICMLYLLAHGKLAFSPKVLYTRTEHGLGFRRESNHCWYKAKTKKVLVNLSSYGMWFYEYQRFVWTEKIYTPKEKMVLSLFVCLRFLKPRMLRRIAGDLLALLTRPGIWNFSQSPDY